jgi:transposase-like protein
MSFSTNNRSTIDSEVYKWVVQQLKKKKVVTPNAIRQKAFEIGQEFDPNFKASINWYNNWKKRFDYNESPEAEALKHKKRSYTAAFKLHAVQRAMELESASQASLELDVSRRCLQRWKEELDVISSVAEHSSNAVYRRPGQGRKVRDTSLDTQLLDWVKECWKQSISLSSGMIREKARELSPQADFKASLGWFVKWQKRHCVDLKEQTCSPSAGEVVTPLKLRLLPEGEVSAYSTPKKRRLSKKRALSYDDTALLENDEEFDRLLLTWLVERWEAGDIVNDKMLKERAMELTANPDFKASKVWLQAWKSKYNVSLENQTYGTDGDEENEEIIEETQVYDEQVVIEGEQQPQEGGSAEAPLTPTKEEAATALSKVWLQAWKSKYNVSLENQTYGTEGDEENEEIIEETQVYDEQVVIEGEQQPQEGGSAEAPLTPTKEEAATALASLSADDHEIAEALQKLANAFGIAQSSSGGGPKEAVSQLAALQQSDNTDFLLEGAGRVAVEEVISEEVVTDEPMVVIEGTGVVEAVATSCEPAMVAGVRTEDISSTTVQSIVDVVSAATQIAQSITGTSNPSVTQPVAESLIQAVANQLSHSSSQSSDTDTQQEEEAKSGVEVNSTTPQVSQDPPQTPSTSLSVATSDVVQTVQTGTSAPMQFITEEVIISEPIVETSMASTEPMFEATVDEGVIGGQMEVLVQGGEGAVVDPSKLSRESTDTIVQLSAEKEQGISISETPVPPAHMISTAPSEIQLVTTGGPENEIVTSPGADMLATGGTETEVSLSGGISIPEGSDDILDIVQETVVGETGGQKERDYDEDFKARVMNRATELGSVQQAAREFSIPWKIVASWNTQD